MALLTVLLSHLSASAVEASVDHVRRMAPDSRLILCHGGRRPDFDAVRFEDKLFIENRGLRGPSAAFQSYNDTLGEVFDRFVAPDESVDKILMLEFDQVLLSREFTQRLIQLMDNSGADLLGKTCVDRTATNWWHRVRYRDDPVLLRFLESVSTREDRRRLYGCLGTGFAMRRQVLEAYTAVTHPEHIYVELYLPTLVHHLGFRVDDIDRYGDLYAHVRSRPPYDLAAALELQRAGAVVLHPFKDVEDLPRLVDTTQ